MAQYVEVARTIMDEVKEGSHRKRRMCEKNSGCDFSRWSYFD